MCTNIAGVWDKAAKLLLDCSTQQDGSAEAEAAVRHVRALHDKLESVDAQPKASWKKMVQQLKVREIGSGALTQRSKNAPRSQMHPIHPVIGVTLSVESTAQR